MTNIKFAILFMGLYALVSGAVTTYIVAMLTTIEKRFDLNSSQMGALMGANDIGYLTCVVLISYIGSKNDRQPLILCLSAVGLWLSSMLYSLPYFMFGPRYSPSDLIGLNSTGRKDVCFGGRRPVMVLPESVVGSEVKKSQQTITMFLFMIAGIINGVSTSPFWNVGISFLDDMAGATKSGIYIGFLFSIRSFAPIIGFLFGSYMSKVHESLKLKVDLYAPGQRDIKWIGAWWLGWFILGWAVLLIAPFLGLLKIKKPKHDCKINSVALKIEESVRETETKVQQLKELIGIIRTSLKNRIYVSLIAGIIFDIISNVCMFTFFTKYLEYHFRASTSKANVLAAISLAGSRLVSSMISGIISKTTKMSVRSMNRFNALTNIVSAVAYPILFIFTCPTVQVTGLSYDLKVCGGACQCQYRKMNPVCLDSETYFSPCVAGCISQINETFFGGCNCNHTMIAKKGFCEQMCPAIYGFLVAFFVVKMIGALSSVQFVSVVLRLCNPKFKAVNLSMIGFIFGIFGLSFPPIAGKLLDSACWFRNTNTFGGKSHCLLYDTDKMRHLIIGVSFVFQIPACMFYVLAWLWTPENSENKNGNALINDDSGKHNELTM